MRLDFNVLWVEDQSNAVQAQSHSIERALRREGFRLRTVFARSVAEATDLLSSEIYGDHIDLVLMDYDLGQKPSGDDGLVAVRSKFEFKDVIFYSSRAEDLKEMVAQKRVQGVYCSTREDLVETVVGAFEALVKKVVDIEHARGIVMGATSDIDHLVNNTLAAVFENSDQGARAATLAVLAGHLKEKRKNFDGDAARAEAVSHVSELSGLYNVYTSNDRLRLLKNMLEALGTHPEDVASMKTYLTSTIPRRNVLAHRRVEVNGFSRKLILPDGTEITSAQMRELRLDLLQYQESLEVLVAALARN